MGEKPILFSGPAVRAVLEGRKDVTRRLMNPQPPENSEFLGNNYLGDWCWSPLSFGAHNEWRSPRYRKGDLLYVKEAWRADHIYDDESPRAIPKYADIEYLATDIPYFAGRYRNARFMCKWMTRLWLRVTEDPYPERARDITEAEAIREGVERFTSPIGVQGWKPYYKGNLDVLQFAVNSYYTLWDSIYKPGAHLTDWAWRYAFERTEAPHG